MSEYTDEQTEASKATEIEHHCAGAWCPAAADAWDEGYEDGVLDGQARGSGAPGEHETPNPHRQANDELRISK